MKESERLSSVSEYYFAVKLREIASRQAAGEDIINLGIGSPDLPPHPDVISTLAEASARGDTHGYQSYRGIPELRSALARWYGTTYGVQLDSQSEIIPLMGSKEGIMHISMAFLGAGDGVLIPNPGYPTYRAAAQIAGARVMEYRFRNDNSGWPDFDAIEKQDLTEIKIMWINYPHMPTGKAATMALFERLIAFARKHSILICHDNPYNTILNLNAISIFAVAGAKEIALELNSLSKTFNMAGWRVGALIGNANLLDSVMKFKSNMDSGMFKPIQLAAAKALSLGQEWVETINKTYALRQDIAFEILDTLGCTHHPVQAGLFAWGAISGSESTGEARSEEILNSASVFIAPGHIFGSAGADFLRISLCAPEEKLREALKRIKSQFRS